MTVDVDKHPAGLLFREIIEQKRGDHHIVGKRAVKIGNG